MPTYITREVSKVQRRVLNLPSCLIRFPSVFNAICIQNMKFLKGKLFSRLHDVVVFVMQIWFPDLVHQAQKKPMSVLFVTHCKPYMQ
jgi:hypothetical protein